MVIKAADVTKRDLIPKTYGSMFRALVASEDVETLCLQWLGNKDNVLTFKKQLRNELTHRHGILSGMPGIYTAGRLNAFLITSNSHIKLKQTEAFCKWLFRSKKTYY